nr:hypothetical protein [Desulfuromusa kysingii]
MALLTVIFMAINKQGNRVPLLWGAVNLSPETRLDSFSQTPALGTTGFSVVNNFQSSRPDADDLFD